MHNETRELNVPHKESRGEDEGGEYLLCMQRKVMNTCMLMNQNPQPCDETIWNKCRLVCWGYVMQSLQVYNGVSIMGSWWIGDLALNCYFQSWACETGTFGRSFY